MYGPAKDKKEDKKLNYYILIIIITIVEIILTSYMVSISDKLYGSIGTLESSTSIEEVKNGTTIIQEFIAKNDNLKKIYIAFDPLLESEEKVSGEVTIELKDDNDNLIGSETITRNYIRENDNVYKFVFDKQKQSNGRLYKVCLTFKGTDDSKIFSIKTIDNDLGDEGKLFIDGTETKGQIAFKQLYLRKIRLLAYIALNIIVFGVCISIAIIIIKKDRIKIEKLFLMTIIPLVVFFILAMPALVNHDEFFHWLRSYELSSGIFYTPISEDGVEGSNLPSAVWDIITDDWTKMNYNSLSETFQYEIDKSQSFVMDSKTSAVYAFVQYIPQAIGILISRMFTNRPLIMVYMRKIDKRYSSDFVNIFCDKDNSVWKKTFLDTKLFPN